MKTAPRTDPIDRAELRGAFGRFATGVTIVTTCDQDGAPMGFTANSFTSVSLDPPLLLVCIGKSSSNLLLFRDGGRFAVNVLAADQTDLSNRFASRKVIDRFAGVPWQAGPTGAPLLAGCAAGFDCDMHEVVDAGDHLVLIGRVVALERSIRPALVFADGQYLVPAALTEPQPQPGVRAGAILQRDGHVLLLATQGGYRLPMSDAHPGIDQAVAALEATLAASGPARVSWESPYAIYDGTEERARHFVFHGQLAPDFTLPDGAVMAALDALPLNDVAGRTDRAMLRRYAEEARSRRYGLFVGSAGPFGAVLPLAAQPPRFLQEQDTRQ